MASRGDQADFGGFGITPAMIEAGADALIESDPNFETAGDRASAVFRAMMAASLVAASSRASYLPAH